jgi:hypothetical protein
VDKNLSIESSRDSLCEEPGFFEEKRKEFKSPRVKKNRGKRKDKKLKKLKKFMNKKRHVVNFELKIRKNRAQEFGQVIPMYKLSSKKFKNIVKNITLGMNRRLNPIRISDGVCGSYYLLNQYKNKEAIFKPKHEELFAPLNPKGFIDNLGTEVHMSGVRSGEMYLREAAAYLMDERGIFDVPETFLGVIQHPFFKNSHKKRDIMSISHYIPDLLMGDSTSIELIQENSNDHFNRMNLKITNKTARVGSIQKKIKNCRTISNISIEKISAFEIQKIALLDMRMLNTERNEENILYKKHKKILKLIPVDNGKSLGRMLKIMKSDLIWTSYPQIHLPLDPRLVKYVKELKPKLTTQKLSKRLGLDLETLNLVRKSEMFLKMCVEKKMTIFEMSELFYRKNINEKSSLEKIIESVDFMSKDFKSRDKWFLQNQILYRSKKFSNQMLNEKISKIKKKPLRKKSKSRKMQISIFKTKLSEKKLLLPKLNLTKFSNKKNSTKNKRSNLNILDYENEAYQDIQQSPLTFLSKKNSHCIKISKCPDFIENEKMKSLNTFSTENPISPFVGEEYKLNLISFSSIEMVEKGNKSQTNLDSRILDNVIYQRRRINSEVITTSVDKNDALKEKKSIFSDLNNVKIENLKNKNLKKNKHYMEDSCQNLTSRNNKQKSSRSLSVFLISSQRGESMNSSFLDDFRQEENKKKIGSFVDSNICDPFKIRKTGSLEKKNLKLHYFKCCLEQLIDGLVMKKTIVSAKRKNTAPLFK